MDITQEVIEAPRGTPNQPRLRLDMTKVDQAESRLQEVKMLNINIVADLKSVFAAGMADLGRYLSLVRYEHLQAKQQLEFAKAEALLDKYPVYFRDTLKETGMKDNADIRESYIARDPDYRHWHTVVNHLDALTSFLEAKNKTLERAYWDCRSNLEDLMKVNNTRTHNSGNVEENVFKDEFYTKPSVTVIGNVAVGTSKF